MDIISNLLTFCGGGGLMALVQFLIQRHDAKSDKFEEIIEKLDDLDKKIDKVQAVGDERNAVVSRVRILKFRDEMLEGRRHTHDSFQQVLCDVDSYEKYCKEHPEFKNNQTVTTIESIKENYKERLEKHDFLG